MSGDLEDFLRRAAQRRQQKAAGPAAKPPQRRQRPEYTDSRRERVTEPIEEAELVEEPAETGMLSDMERTIAEQRKRIREAEERAAAIRAQAKKKAKTAAPRSGQRDSTLPPLQPVITREGIAALLTKRDGLRQAILLKEILERPEHRW